MPRPTHRIDVVAVPAVPDALPIDGARALLGALHDVGILVEGGRPGPAAARWMPSGFARVRLDRPGAMTLYANRLGGFRVRCPRTGSSVVPAFSAAMTALREGGGREMVCPSCGERHPLQALDFTPPAALGRMALVTADAGEARLTSEARQRVVDHLGPVRWVVARV